MTSIKQADRLRIELRHLAALDAVARHGSFGAAASELDYTQSAVSQQIDRLERAVGSRLFERPGGPRPVRLTESGQVLWRHARAVLARMEAAAADVTALAEGSVGELRVGTYQSVAVQLLPAVIARFRERWPRIELSFVESGSHDELEALVERGALDLAFTILPVSDGLFASEQLFADPYLLVVPADHALVHAGAAPTLEQLGALDLVAYRVCRANAQVERFLRSQGLEPNVVFRAEDNLLLQALVAEGVGAALMPLLAVDRSHPRTAALALDGRIPARRTALVWHRDRHRTSAALAFGELARAAAAAVAAEVETLPPATLAGDLPAPR
jgi:DNA-binding transcriptional LysR family regulator